MQRRINKCGYCGKADRLEREHVIPRCPYPDSKAKSRVQRLTVLSCGDCNRGWSDDEAHFRNVLLVAGDPNDAVQELWTTTARRSFKQSDAHRRLRDLTALMEPVQLDGKDRWMSYPARDERVLRVIKKVVRGLSHHHGVESALPETRITADVMKFRIPDEFLKEIQFQHREADIIQYWHEIFEDGVTSSVWPGKAQPLFDTRARSTSECKIEAVTAFFVRLCTLSGTYFTEMLEDVRHRPRLIVWPVGRP